MSNKLTIAYNGTSNEYTIDGTAPIIYNGSTLVTMSAGDSKVLNCNGKYALTDISIGGKVLSCANKIFASSITTSLASVDVNETWTHYYLDTTNKITNTSDSGYIATTFFVYVQSKPSLKSATALDYSNYKIMTSGDVGSSNYNYYYGIMKTNQDYYPINSYNNTYDYPQLCSSGLQYCCHFTKKSGSWYSTNYYFDVYGITSESLTKTSSEWQSLLGSTVYAAGAGACNGDWYVKVS